MVKYTPRQLNTISYHIAENFRGRIKAFTNFAALEPPAKVFSMKFGRVVPTYVIGFSIPRKFSPRNDHFFIPIRENFFLPQKFPAIQYTRCAQSARLAI